MDAALHAARDGVTVAQAPGTDVSAFNLADALRGVVTLGDGRRVRIRPMLAQDARAEQEFVSGLSSSSRYLRFHVGLHELPPSLLRLLTQIDQQQHVAIVAEALGEEHPVHGGRWIVADARYVLGSDPTEAEFAVAVDDDWQRLGLGRELLARLVTHARSRGVRRVVGDVLRDNRPMAAMVRALGGRMVASSEGGLLRQAVFET